MLRDELYVMLMLQRSEENGAGVDCEDTDVVLACLEDLDNCPAACKAEYEDEGETSDEVVKSGDLAVTASANDSIIVKATPSDLDTITFKTSEEVEISKVTLERYGFSAATDIVNVWLENDDGMVISNKKPVNNKGLSTLTIDKDYRKVDGTFNATIVVQTIGGIADSATIGFKVTDVESTAANVDLPTKKPTTYSVVAYNGSNIVTTTRAGTKEYNYVEGEMYEVAKFKVKAADDAAILVKGFSLVDVATAPNVARIGDVVDNVTVTIDDVEVEWLKFSTDKRKLTVSFDDVEIAAKQSANIVLSMSLTDFDNNYGSNIDFTLTDTDFNAVEAKTSVRVQLTKANGTALWTLALQTNKFIGGKIKYTSTKLPKVEAAAGAKDVVLAEGSIEIPEAITATFSIPANHAVIEEMRMYVAGEEFDGTWNTATNKFDFDIELTKWGKVKFEVDVDDGATKWTKVSLWSLALSNFTTLVYDSNNVDLIANPTLGDVAGSISFSDLTVTEAKASLENNADDTVEFVVKETNRKVVFDGTYTAKKADIYLNSFRIDGAAFTHGNVTFYLYLDGEEVADIDVPGNNEDFTKVLVEAWKSISVKVEAEVEAGNTATTSNYAYALALNGEDVDDLPVAESTADLAEMAVVNKGSVSVTSTAGKTTVLLKKANAKIAEFTVKPDKWNDTYLESLGFTLTNGTVNLTADDVNVKIDGVTEDGENYYAADFDTATTYTAGDLVVYNGVLYATAAGGHAAGAWAATDFDDLTFSTATTYTAGDLAVYNGVLYATAAGGHAAGAWAAADFAVQPTQITFSDLAQELDSDGVTVEVTLKNKKTGIVTLDLDDVNGKDPNKTFTKRFENALVWVADQRDNEGSTTFTLWVSKAESSDEVTRVCLYYANNGNEKCVTSSVSDGNDDLEWTNPGSTQLMIDAIAYEINGAGDATAGNECKWDNTANDTDGLASYDDSNGTCVVITKNDYNDYFKVGDTYAKIFKVD